MTRILTTLFQIGLWAGIAALGLYAWPLIEDYRADRYRTEEFRTWSQDLD